ncbi:hypothetical protein FF011L_22330 [Roseimaritima multifibrata]|uniref:DUF2029 domain-containing protein n=1 Tax=Roseimaritima multifibrata TaxID=1930274 RepID=A0A517MF02_9BACT|nr:glycosyltransferase family 87 protein [Roseimaritima multifibrata]QDS93463.1 hypothetical protein FF011L_22330 [Roseimaritima multifibrata]
MSQNRVTRWLSLPAAQWLAVALLVVGLAATAARVVKQYQTPGPFDPTRQGYCDFHNGVYFPAAAWLQGISPYGQEYASRFPVARSVPFFSPSIYVLHVPFALLPLHVAEVGYFLFSIGVVLAIAQLVAKDVASSEKLQRSVFLWTAVGIVFSRGGHITLFDGYFTLLLIGGSFLAISQAEKRPWLAAVGLLLASSKPTFILPLGILLVARGNYRAIWRGAFLSVFFAAVGFAWIAYHQSEESMYVGMQEIVAQISQTQEIHQAELDEMPVHSWTRLDLLAIIAKWTGHNPGALVHLWGMFAVLVIPCWVLLRRSAVGEDDGLTGVTGALVLVATLVSLYHQSYDALLVVAPLAGVVVGQSEFWTRLPAMYRWGIGLGLLIPLFNYLSTRMFIDRVNVSDRFIQVVTSLNGVCLTLVLLMLCWSAIRYSYDSPADA